MAVAVARESDLAAVRRPSGLHVPRRVRSEARAPGAVRGDDVDVGVTIGGVGERELRDWGACDVELDYGRAGERNPQRIRAGDVAVQRHRTTAEARGEFQQIVPGSW